MRARTVARVGGVLLMLAAVAGVWVSVVIDGAVGVAIGCAAVIAMVGGVFLAALYDGGPR